MLEPRRYKRGVFYNGSEGGCCDRAANLVRLRYQEQQPLAIVPLEAARTAG